MKKIITILTLTICFFISNNAGASHMVGSDITYSCTSTPGIWHFKICVYRDCTGIPLCGGSCGSPCTRTLSISGYDGSCAGTSYGSATVSLTRVEDVNPNPQCPNAKSICTDMGCVTAGSYVPGVERYTFEGDVNLGSSSGIPASCCRIAVSWAECCRNGTIATGPAGNNFYIEAMIDRCQSLTPCNSAPDFTNDPFAVLCGGQPYVFNSGTFDPDHDSLSYSFTPGLQGHGSPVTYTAPYSATSPMPFSGSSASAAFPLGIHCDSITGDISFTPPYSGSGYFVGVVAIQIKQWKKIGGVATIVGITMRDIQMWLMQCPMNNIPWFKTISYDSLNVVVPPNATKISWKAIAGQQICFDIIGKDTDFSPFSTPPISDTTFLSWNGSLAQYGATFLPKYNPPVGGLPWRRSHGIREDIYQFCWTPDSSKVSNIPYFFTATVRDSRCPNPGRRIQAFGITVIGDANLAINQNRKGCYSVQCMYSPIGNSQTITYSKFTISKVPNNYSLTNADTFTNVPTTPYLSFSQAGNYLVKLTASTATGILKTFYDTIRIDTPITISVNDTSICRGSTATFNYLAHGGISPYTYRWFVAPDTSVTVLDSANVNATTFSLTPNITTKYILQARDSKGCRGYDTSVMVTVRQLPVSPLPASMRICNGTSYALDAGNNNGNIKKYLWNTGDSTKTITRNDSNLFVVTLTDTFGCKLIDSLLLFVNNAVVANAGIDKNICVSGTVLLHSTGGQNYQWKNLLTNNVIAPKSSTADVNVSIGTTTPFEVTVFVTQSGLECSKTDTTVVIVNPKPATPVITGLAIVPRGQVNNFSVTNNEGSSYSWFVSNGNINSGNGTNQVSVVFTNKGNGSLKVLETASTICASDTGIKSVIVDFGIGITEQSSFEYCRIFPNPTSGILNIELTTDEKQIQIEVTDVLGKIVKTNLFHHTTGIFKTEIELNSLHKGIYFVNVKAGGKLAVSRITLE